MSCDEKPDTSSSPGKHKYCKVQVHDTVTKRCMKKLSSNAIEAYALEKDRTILYDLISAAFPDSKRRTMLRLPRDCVLRVSAWSQKQD